MGNGRGFKRRATNMPGPQDSTPVGIQPAPLPIQWMLGSADLPDGSRAIVLQLITPAGTNLYFLPPDAADQFAEALKAQASQARSGLIIPTLDPTAIVQDLHRRNGAE